MQIVKWLLVAGVLIAGAHTVVFAAADVSQELFDVVDRSYKSAKEIPDAVEKIKELLLAGANVNFQEQKYNYTPLHAAASFGIKEVVRVLLEHNANVFAETKSGRFPAEIAAGRGHTDAVLMIREKAAQLLTNAQERFSTMIGSLVDFTKPDKQLTHEQDRDLRICLMAGADINTYQKISFFDGTVKTENLLIDATIGLKSWLVEWLLKHNAQVNVRDADGNTPLHIAAETGKKIMVEDLLAAGADVTLKNNAGETAVQYAEKKSKRLSVVEAIALIKAKEPVPVVTEPSESSVVDQLKESLVVLKTKLGALIGQLQGLVVK